MHFYIQVADVGLDTAVLSDATATSGMSDIDASSNPSSKTQGELVGVGKSLQEWVRKKFKQSQFDLSLPKFFLSPI